MAQRIIAREAGGPEVLELQTFTPPEPGVGELRVANRAIGLNFIDTYHRSGLYPRSFPTGLGSEGAGVVEAIGPGFDGFTVGDRVAYLGSESYATHSMAPAATSFKLPDNIEFDTAAALLLKGITAWMLVECVRPVQPGMTVLVHAAAGGVGQIVVRWVKALGGTVIAHAGSAEKAAIATALGADHALHCPYGELAAQVREFTNGKGTELVLDGVGKDSWPASLASVARLGLIASYGNASGPVPPVAPLNLTRAGSVFLTRPTLFDWINASGGRDKAWARLTAIIENGTIEANIGQRFALTDAAEAHRALEGRQTTGATILVP